MTAIGIDTGGTFTDFVLIDGNGLRVHKVPSTPDDPARAVLEGLAELLAEREAGDSEGGAAGARPLQIVHGSTVATNALLERKGARVVLVTTAGFEDVIEIGRQARTAIYDLGVRKAPPLAPPERRLGVAERVGPRGEVLVPLEGEEIERIASSIARGPGGSEPSPEAVAICLLHAYANPSHERALAGAIRAAVPGAFVSPSHEVLPEFREYERASTTVVNAYVGPVVSRYLGELERGLAAGRVRIMQSSGGVLSLQAARQLAVHTILSGPAGGAVGGFEVARRAGFENAITFDMGGTSTDVSLCAGGLSRTAETVIGEVPIRVPALDIHSVGAGGGSIAYRDPGGSLRVGPESAGADPGPICYGHAGREVTVTDANLFLGRLSGEHFLGGTRPLLLEPVREAMAEFASRLGLSPTETAEGVIRVANATMERAIRVISLERGHDPRDFTLVCFGGAGAMHAADLARGLGIPRVLVPQAAGTLSALGMLLADVVRDFSWTVLVPCRELKARALEETFGELEAQARREFRGEEVAPEALRLERALDMRYVGQGYELTVPWAPDLAGLEAAFHRRHERRYGYADPARPVEVVNVRLRAVGVKPKPRFEEEEPAGEDASAAVIGTHRIVFGGVGREASRVDRGKLRSGNRFAGPALVVEYSTTTVVPPGTACRVDGFRNLVLESIGPDGGESSPGEAR